MDGYALHTVLIHIIQTFNENRKRFKFNFPSGGSTDDFFSTKMALEQQEKRSLFATEIGGPMVFTFDKILIIEKNKISQNIQDNGGKVIEYNDRDEYTVVLTKPSKRSSDEIQFDLRYIKDCLKMKKTLPLETYRLDKKVKVGCYYSTPFGTKRCMYSKFILQGNCKMHSCVLTDEIGKKAHVNSDDEAKINQQLEFIENLIYVERKPQVKVELLDISEIRMDEAQESQSFDESQSLLRRRLK